jgi:hypothetical protein
MPQYGLKQYYSDIVVFSFIGGEKHQPATNN